MPSKYKQGSMKVYIEVITTIKYFYKFDHIHPLSRNIHLNKVTLFCSRKHFIQTADGASDDGRPHPFLVTFDETFDWKTCLMFSLHFTRTLLVISYLPATSIVS